MRTLLEDAVRTGAFPGCALAVVTPGEQQLFFAGNTFYGGGEPIDAASRFDMASLTKVVVTTTLLMSALDEKRIGLDDRAGRFLDGMAAPQVTLRQLLAHGAGYPAGLPFFQSHAALDPALRPRLVRQTELVSEPGQAECYSDIGFMILGQVLEAVHGMPLDQLAQERIFHPLGMAQACFARLDREPLAHAVPTEERTEEAGTYWTGYPHDENCRWLGGVAGHAGLFCTLDDCLAFARFLLKPGKLVDPDLFSCFLSPANVVCGSRRCLGWDRRDNGVIWHTGFTGTTLCLDQDAQRVTILLTNAVHPRRECKRQGYFSWRNRILEAVAGL